MSDADEHYIRGRHLYHIDRDAEAEREFRAALALDLSHEWAGPYLALSLSAQGQTQKAIAAAHWAIGRNPESPFAHAARGWVLFVAGQPASARLALRESLRLDAAQPGTWAALADLDIIECKWRDAVTACQAGLALDPQHAGCLRNLANAQIALGQKGEALTILQGALRQDPESARTHAATGWAHLNVGHAKAAFASYREALRLDPTLVQARAGLVAALKGRNFVYAVFLRYKLWMSRRPKGVRFALIALAILGFLVLMKEAKTHPSLDPWVGPVRIVFFGILAATWVIDPLFNTLLRLHPLGRSALSEDQLAGSNRFLLVVLAVLGFLACVTLPPPVVGALAGCGVGVVSIVCNWRKPPGWARRVGVASASVGLAGVLTFCASMAMSLEVAAQIGGVMMIGFVLGPFAMVVRDAWARRRRA